MNGKIRKYLPLLGIVAVLVLWGLWYSRPVGVETLFPDFDPDRVEVIASDHNVSPTESYLKGTPEYDAALSEVRGLQFRRSVWNPIRQILPYRGVRPITNPSSSISSRMTGRRTTRSIDWSLLSISGLTVSSAATASSFRWE